MEDVKSRRAQVLSSLGHPRRFQANSDLDVDVDVDFDVNGDVDVIALR
jgi:hypothetical protein